MSSQQDENAASRTNKRQRLNGDNLTESTDTPTYEEQPTELQGRTTDGQTKVLFNDAESVGGSFTNALITDHHAATFSAQPTTSSSQPEHGKLHVLRGTKIDSLRALLATQPA